MNEPDISALEIGAWVASTAICLWLDQPILNRPVGDILAGAVPSTLQLRRLAREFEQIGDTIAEWLMEDAPEQAGLAAEILHRRTEQARRVLLDVSISRPDALSKWRDPVLVASLICEDAGIPLAGGSVILGSCVALREVLAHMRHDKDTGVLSDLAEVPDLVLRALRGISARDLNPSSDQFDSMYRRRVVESNTQLRDITPPFVWPRVRFQGDTAPLHFAFPLAGRRRLILQGEPGIGKTTTVQWLAVQAASAGERSGEPAGPDRLLPFFVRLRDWSRSRSEPTHRLVDLATAWLGMDLSSQLVHQNLARGSALVLVDGLDELPATDRFEAWDWLGALAAQFPAAGMVVTTRPTALRGLPSIDGFEAVDLLPMGIDEVAEYAHQWFSAAVSDSDDVVRCETALRETVANSSDVAQLAGNPWMCSLLCRLTLRRGAVLPTKHDIYAAVVNMLLDTREPASSSSSTRLRRMQAITLLEQIAYWFLNNGYVEADRSDVLHQIERELLNMPEIADSPEHVLQSLVETSAGSPAVLRESVPGRIDFAHQSLAEYLAARAVVDQGAIGSLIGLAHEAGWGEVAVLAAEQASERDSERLVSGLLNRAGSEFLYRDRLLGIAGRCLDTLPDLRDSALEGGLARMLGQKPRESRGQDRLVMAVDIADFAAVSRTRSHQLAMTDGLVQILQDVFDDIGVAWHMWLVQQSGDGILVVAPSGTSARHLLSLLPGKITSMLRRFNASRSAEADLRLRVAVDRGAVSQTAVGLSGASPVRVARMLDSHVVRDALRRSAGALAVIQSDEIYRQQDGRPDRYVHHRIETKEIEIDVWVAVFGADPDTHVDNAILQGMSRPTPVLLAQIERALANVAQREAAVPLQQVQRIADLTGAGRDGLAVLRHPGIGVIAELPTGLDPVHWALDATVAGARVLGLGLDSCPRSVLEMVRDAVDAPLLCNDVVISPYQVYEARSWGADMVRLIVGAVTTRTLAQLCDLTTQLGMTAVVAAWNSAEADRALEAGARVVSIGTGEAGLEKFQLVAGDLPEDVLTIAEDVSTAHGATAFARAGATAVLLRRDFNGDFHTAIQEMVSAEEHPWSSRPHWFSQAIASGHPDLAPKSIVDLGLPESQQGGGEQAGADAESRDSSTLLPILRSQADDPDLPPAVRADLLVTLGLTKQSLALETQDLELLDAAVANLRHAIAISPADAPDRVRHVIACAQALFQRFQVNGSNSDLTEAAVLLEECRDRSGGPAYPYWSVLCAILADVYRHAGDAGRSRDTARDGLRGHTWDLLLQPSTLAVAVAGQNAADEATALAYGYLADGDLDGAIGTLEVGRGLLLQSATKFADVPERLSWLGAPQLADRWAAVVGDRDPAFAPVALRREVMERLAAPMPVGAGVRGPAVEPAEIRATLAHLGVDALIYLVPGRPGGGPGAAVIVTPSVSSHLLLPSLNRASAPELAVFLKQDQTRDTRWADPRPPEQRELTPAADPMVSSWRSGLDAVCRWAWTAAIGPLLDSLTHHHRLPTNRPPRLVLIPMGALARVPWHAARGPQGSYAVEGAVFSYAISARLLCDSALADELAASQSGLVLGNPDTGVAADSLTSAAIEAAAVRDAYYPAARYLGREASGAAAPDGRGSRTELERWLADTRADAGTMLHIACHSTMIPGPGDYEPASFLRLADGETLSTEDLLRGLVTGRSCGLGLSVLAACSSGVADERHDEAFSVAAALLAGGTRTVVSALWPLPDGDTSVLMFLFHHFRQRLPTVDALRAAQMWMLHPESRESVPMPDLIRAQLSRADTASPAAWAGFVHMGQGWVDEQRHAQPGRSASPIRAAFSVNGAV